MVFDTNCAFIDVNGNNGTAQIGDPLLPFQTAQAAYDISPDSIFVLGIGEFTISNITTPIKFRGCGSDFTSLSANFAHSDSNIAVIDVGNKSSKLTAIVNDSNGETVGGGLILSACYIDRAQSGNSGTAAVSGGLHYSGGDMALYNCFVEDSAVTGQITTNAGTDPAVNPYSKSGNLTIENCRGRLFKTGDMPAGYIGGSTGSISSGSITAINSIGTFETGTVDPFSGPAGNITANNCHGSFSMGGGSTGSVSLQNGTGNLLIPGTGIEYVEGAFGGGTVVNWRGNIQFDASATSVSFTIINLQGDITVTGDSTITFDISDSLIGTITTAYGSINLRRSVIGGIIDLGATTVFDLSIRDGPTTTLGGADINLFPSSNTFNYP